MFDWLFEKNDKIISYMEILQSQIKELNASKFAMHKCISMIANAIAKSEIVIQGESGLRIDEIYYRLNVQPNDNETGTEFWKAVTARLLIESECLIIPMGSGLDRKFYIADTWTEDNTIMRPRKYSNITLECARQTIQLRKNFKADEVIHLRLPATEQKRQYFMNVAQLYDKTASTAATLVQLANTPKWGVGVDTNVRLVEKSADGTDKVLTGREYVDRIKNMLTSDDIVAMMIPQGVSIEALQTSGSSSVSTSDLDSLIQAAESAAARAFDIPQMVYFGTISDKSDATNEFITYAVGPVAECINDGMNASLVGMDDYINKNERVMIFLARFKHIDIIDSADKLSKMRGDGWTLDEIFHLVGYPELHTDFTMTRALTKNYATAEAGGAVDSESK